MVRVLCGNPMGFVITGYQLMSELELLGSLIRLLFLRVKFAEVGAPPGILETLWEEHVDLANKVLQG